MDLISRTQVICPLFMFEISICSSPKEHNEKPGLRGRDNRQVPTAVCVFGRACVCAGAALLAHADRRVLGNNFSIYSAAIFCCYFDRHPSTFIVLLNMILRLNSCSLLCLPLTGFIVRTTLFRRLTIYRLQNKASIKAFIYK